ncbi:hypothetical protein SELMODRAFT_411739 [Selaginella moellendorffii]|uniref:Uncharacterized protein n=1 Tax=Selaginella moellendorffii TaxID=88036 RepID=D8RIW4_SELML|nr:hypothetical protein SELMODRAFT_411739 [Selaginella moellendorffii]
MELFSKGASSSRAPASQLVDLMMQMGVDDRPSQLRMIDFAVSASEILCEGVQKIRKNMEVALSRIRDFVDQEIIDDLFSDDRWKEKNEVTYNQSERVIPFVAVFCFRKGASTSDSAPASWEGIPELQEDLFPGISREAQKRQRLHSLITRAPKVINFELGGMNRLREEQLALSGTIEGSKLGGSNDFILYLSGPIEVRLLFVARSDSSLEELEALYPKGASITVKKHLRLEGRCVVDNPGNVEIVSCFPTTMRELGQKASSELRSLGNQHFHRKQYLAAIELYNLSISKADNERDKLLAFGNASHCHLELENFFCALQNAEKALALTNATENVLSVKLLTRKGRALHGMLKYKDAVQAYKLALLQQRSTGS